MADADQIDNQKEYNDLQYESVDISFSILESLKETLGIKSRMTEFDRSLLQTNREINKVILNRKTSFENMNSLSKEILKLEDLKTKAATLGMGLSIQAESNKIKNLQTA